MLGWLEDSGIRANGSELSEDRFGGGSIGNFESQNRAVQHGMCRVVSFLEPHTGVLLKQLGVGDLLQPRTPTIDFDGHHERPKLKPDGRCCTDWG